MKKLAYEGDGTSHGGQIVSGSDRIKIKGRRAARIGDIVSCPIHGHNEIVEGGTSMTDAGVPVSRDGDRTQCGSFLADRPARVSRALQWYAQLRAEFRHAMRSTARPGRCDSHVRRD